MVKYYVTMTDKFLSGWGGAEGRIAKYVLICNTHDEAEVVAQNARKRGEMKNIQIVTQKPKYDKKRYQVDFTTKRKTPNWYKPNMGR